MRHFCISIILVSLFIFWPSSSVLAQTNLSGLLQNYTAVQTTPDYEFIAVRNRLRLKAQRSISNGSVSGEIDITNRSFNSADTELMIRELYAEWFTNNYDIRLGNQKIIWGNSDVGFVNDILTPVDLREFLTQDPEDLRFGLNAISISRFFGSHALQLVISPVRQRDLLPEPGSRWFPVQDVDGPININFTQPEHDLTIRNVQAVLQFRWRPTGSFDLDLMAYHWAHPMPAFGIFITEPTFGNFIPSVTLEETYQTSPMVGYSKNWQISDSWILKSEGLYSHNRLFTFLPVSVDRLEEALDDFAAAVDVAQEFEIRDDGYLLSKPWYKQMIGVQTEWKSTVISLQGFIETIFDYEDRILPQQYFPYASLLLQRSFLRDRLQTIALSRYNIFGNDYWVQFQSIYEVADDVEVALGTNLFGGEEISPFYGHFTFEQFSENSFLFGRISVFF